MRFVREPTNAGGSVYWVGIGFDPVARKPYRQGISDPNQWNRWEAAGIPTQQLDAPMNPADWSTLPPTGPAVTASASISDTQVKAIADAAAKGAAAGAGDLDLTIQLSGKAVSSED